MRKFPARCVMIVLLSFGMANLYCMRTNMSVAILAMVNKFDIHNVNRTWNDSACPQLLTVRKNQSTSYEKKVAEGGGTYDWDTETEAQILGSFFYGFSATIFFGGVLSQKVSAKWLFGLAVFGNSILNLLTPVASTLGATPVIVFRSIQGGLQGAAFPARAILISNWMPIMERSRAMTLTISGVLLGTTFGFALSGVLADSVIFGGWPAAFYVFGMIGCVWFLMWSFLVYDTPSDHPWISDAELRYIQQHQAHFARKMPPVPWLSILKSLPMWAMTISVGGEFFNFSTLSAEVPSYLDYILHIDIKTNGFYSGLPYIIAVFVAYLGGHIADKLRENGKVNITIIRKVMNSLSFLIPAACFVAIAFMGCNRSVNVSLICIAIIMNGFRTSGSLAAVVDMSPTYSGILTGISYTFGSFGSILGPYAVGQLTKIGHTVENWSWVFIMLASVYIFAATVFNFFGTAEIQPWDSPSAQKKSGENCDEDRSKEIAKSDSDNKTVTTKL